MPYRVKSIDRPWPGRHRDGRFFPKNDWVILRDEELTDGIKSDPCLTVEAVGEEMILPEGVILPALPPLPDGPVEYTTIEGSASQPAPYATGDTVEYTNSRGETKAKTILAVNPDGTLDLGPKLRSVDPEAVRRVSA